MSRFKKLMASMMDDNFDPKFIDPSGLSDKDVYPDMDVPAPKSKFDPKFIDPVGLSDKDVYPFKFEKEKPKPFKIRRKK